MAQIIQAEGFCFVGIVASQQTCFEVFKQIFIDKF